MIIDSVAALWALIAKDKVQHWVWDGAQTIEIETIERQLGIRLPSDYIEFLKYTDGAVLFQTEELLGTKAGWEYGESIAIAKDRLNKQVPPLPSGLIPFHQSGTVHCFRKLQSKLEDGFSIVEWNPVTGQFKEEYDSFIDWINRYLIPVGKGGA